MSVVSVPRSSLSRTSVMSGQSEAAVEPQLLHDVELANVTPRTASAISFSRADHGGAGAMGRPGAAVVTPEAVSRNLPATPSANRVSVASNSVAGMAGGVVNRHSDSSNSGVARDEPTTPAPTPGGPAGRAARPVEASEVRLQLPEPSPSPPPSLAADDATALVPLPSATASETFPLTTPTPQPSPEAERMTAVPTSSPPSQPPPIPPRRTESRTTIAGPGGVGLEAPRNSLIVVRSSNSLAADGERDRSRRRTTVKRWTVCGVALIVLFALSLVAIAVLSWQLVRASSASQSDTIVEPTSGTAGISKEALATLATSLLTSVNSTANPCHDFYEYACGGWLENAKIPNDRVSVSRTFTSIADRNLAHLRQVMEENWPLIGPLYRSCMNEDAAEQFSLESFQTVINKLNEMENISDLFRVSGELVRTNGISLFWTQGVVVDIKQPTQHMFNVGEGGAQLPGKSYYHDPRMMEAYVGHIARMLSMYGGDVAPDTETALSHAQAIVKMEKQIVSYSMTGAQARSPEKQYNRLDPRLMFPTPAAWNDFAAGMQLELPTDYRVNFESPQFMSSLFSLLYTTPLPNVRVYAIWSALRAVANYLPKPFQTETFNFFNRLLRGQKMPPARWQTCTNLVGQSLPDLVGRYYVQRAFSPNSKTVSLEMIDDVKAAWSVAIGAADWMDDATREAALGKLHGVTNKIGYPANWTDYSELSLQSGMFLENAFRLAEFSWQINLNRLGKAVSKDSWAMSADTVNAYYDPSLNSINFPAGIIQPPFFTPLAPAVVNFGGIGSVMGHELGHGFDDQGRQFDARGAMTQWWTNASIASFVDRAKCYIRQYSQVRLTDDGSIEWDLLNATSAAINRGPGLRLNGVLTLGENIADNGGVRASFRAYRAFEARRGVDGQLSSLMKQSNDQIFFLAYAQSWCQLQRKDYTKMLIRTDPHSPSEVRVNLPLANFPEFAEAYQCPAGSPMNPAERCDNLW